MPLTVASVFVRGPYPYTADYVFRLRQMVARWLPRAHRFVCLTDRPELLPGLDTIRIQVGPHPADGYWAKVQLFDRRHGFVGRVLYLDLDSLVVAPLDPIVDFLAPFALTDDAYVLERAHLDRDRYGRRLVRKFNSSVMVWSGDEQGSLFDAWTPADAERLSTDQDFIAERAPGAAAMPLSWFPRISHMTRDASFAATGAPMPVDAKVILCKKPKPHQAVVRWPWIDAVWGAA